MIIVFVKFGDLISVVECYNEYCNFVIVNDNGELMLLKCVDV